MGIIVGAVAKENKSIIWLRDDLTKANSMGKWTLFPTIGSHKKTLNGSDVNHVNVTGIMHCTLMTHTAILHDRFSIKFVKEKALLVINALKMVEKLSQWTIFWAIAWPEMLTYLFPLPKIFRRVIIDYKMKKAINSIHENIIFSNEFHIKMIEIYDSNNWFQFNRYYSKLFF